MRDYEFSSPGREYSQSGREFSRAGREWSAAPVKETPAQWEYEGESKAAPKKKRRRQPGMLATAAAAVVTLSVALTPTPTAVSPVYPILELSGEQKAFLDTVQAAMEADDVERLTELAQDPFYHDFIVGEVTDYARMLADDYGLPTMPFEEDPYPLIEGGFMNLYYDGKGLCSSKDRPWDTETLFVGYAVLNVQDTDQPSSYQAVTYFILNRRREFLEGFYYNRSYTLDIDIPPVGQTTLESYNSHVSYKSGNYQEVSEGDMTSYVMADGLSFTRQAYVYRGVATVSEKTCTGQFEPMLGRYDSIVSFLENGTVRMVETRAGDYDIDLQLEVTDGILQMTPDVYVRRHDSDSGPYFTLYTQQNGIEVSLKTDHADSENDFLYRTFNEFTA